MLKDYKINYLQINNQNILTIESPQGEKYGLAECIEEESYFSLSSEQVKDLVNEMRKVTPKKIPIKESKLVADLIEHNLFVKPVKGKWDEEIESQMLAAAIATKK